LAKQKELYANAKIELTMERDCSKKLLLVIKMQQEEHNKIMAENARLLAQSLEGNTPLSSENTSAQESLKALYEQALRSNARLERRAEQQQEMIDNGFIYLNLTYVAGKFTMPKSKNESLPSKANNDAEDKVPSQSTHSSSTNEELDINNKNSNPEQNEETLLQSLDKELNGEDQMNVLVILEIFEIPHEAGCAKLLKSKLRKV
jgi:hypothetical protein